VRRNLLIGLAIVALGAGGLALGASQSVSLTASGPQPATVTVEWGDAVTFANSDTTAHAVSLPRLDVTSPEIPPGGNFQYPFAVRAGTYPFRQLGGTVSTGEVIVNVSGTLTLVASSPTIPYGKSLKLTGRSTQPGAEVTIRQRPFGDVGDWEDAAKVRPGADGAFSASFKLTGGRRYRAYAADEQVRSPQISVTVQPAVTIRPAGRRGKTGAMLTVSGRLVPAAAAESAYLERYETRRRSWRTIDSRPVTRSGGVVFRWEVEQGRSRLRIAVRRGGLAPGFEPNLSSSVVVTGIGSPPSDRRPPNDRS
jgi:hypothetical protein